jgi:hypothetical protein
LEHGLAGGRRGVEALLVQEEIDPLIVQPLQNRQQVRERPAKLRLFMVLRDLLVKRMPLRRLDKTRKLRAQSGRARLITA